MNPVLGDRSNPSCHISTLMVKSHLSNCGSINPLTKDDRRASFNYSMSTGSYDSKNSSTKSYSGSSSNASSMSLGYDGIHPCKALKNIILK